MKSSLPLLLIPFALTGCSEGTEEKAEATYSEGTAPSLDPARSDEYRRRNGLPPKPRDPFEYGMTKTVDDFSGETTTSWAWNPVASMANGSADLQAVLTCKRPENIATTDVPRMSFTALLREAPSLQGGEG